MLLLLMCTTLFAYSQEIEDQIYICVNETVLTNLISKNRSLNVPHLMLTELRPMKRVSNQSHEVP